MDPLPATWTSQMELDDPALLHYWQMTASTDQPENYNISFSNPEIGSSKALQSPGIIVRPPSTLTLCTCQKETLFKMPSSSPPISTQFVSFGSSNSTKPSPYQHHEMPTFTVENEAETNQMIRFGSLGFSSTESPSSLQELFNQYVTTGYGQSFKGGGSGFRTPLQAKYHVIAERKRREKLLQLFISLSAVVPGLKKLSKTAIIDGAIDHLKELERRLNILEEGAKLKHQESVLAEQKPCICFYHEENFSPSIENFKASFDQTSKNIEIRILKRDVLIRVTCENRIGLTEEEFVSVLKEFDLIVTKPKFMPFGDNMLAVSAVAKMNEALCLTEEELANNMREAILKLF